MQLDASVQGALTRIQRVITRVHLHIPFVKTFLKTSHDLRVAFKA